MTTERKDITDEMMMRGCQATPREELERQIMSSLVPKNEREHWSAREIESLREQVKMLHEKLTYADLILEKEYNRIVPSIRAVLAHRDAEVATHDKDKIIAAAKKCGYWSGQTIEMNDVGILRFYAIAFEAGRQAEREECLDICINHASDYAVFNCEPYESMEQGALSCALTIRARNTK